jgi:hypothetical protein
LQQDSREREREREREGERFEHAAKKTLHKTFFGLDRESLRLVLKIQAFQQKQRAFNEFLRSTHACTHHQQT